MKIVAHRRRAASLPPKESDEKYRDLFENAIDPIFIVDANLNYMDVNKKAVEVLGYTRKELLNMSIIDVIPPEQIPKSQKEFETLRKKGAYENFTGRMRAKDGRWIEVEVSSSAIVKDGKLIGSRDIVRDITIRRQMEEELRKERDRAQLYLDVAGVIMIVIDASQTVTLINKKGCEILGYESSEIVGKNWFDLFIPENVKEKTKSVFAKLMTGDIEPVEYFENAVITKSGEERMIAWHNTYLKDFAGNITGTLSSGQDITDRKKMEEELLKIEKLESIGILAGGLAHDFNNLLAAVLGNITLAKMYAEPDEHVVERLKEAEKATLRAKDLTQQLLTFSRGGAPVKEVASVGSIVKDSCSFTLRGSNVKCECTVPDNLWPVELDEGQIHQAINNLIINADQAMPQGGIIRIQCENITLDQGEVPSLPQGDYVKLSILDEGIGIPKKYIDKIFDPYFTTKQRGSGLGLATTYSIVKKHDGHISIESVVGKGSVFNVYLPATRKRVREQKREDDRIFKGSGRILVMDDEKTVREVMGEILKSLGYTVDFADDGTSAIEKYTNAKSSGQPFDAVIMDLTVPGGKGGMETVSELLQFDPSIKAIASSGYSNDPVMAEFRKFGFSDVIRKPCNIKILSKIVYNVTTEQQKV